MPAPEQNPFEIGTTYLLDAAGAHLWVVLSDPQADPDHVLIVSLTTWHAHKDQMCIIERGDHPWATHRTCVPYAKAMVVQRDQLIAGKNQGLLKIKEPMPQAVLQRIWQGAAQSTFIPQGGADILRRQGLIP